jgi:hypothetical protein
MMRDQVPPICDTDELEADVTAVIEACGGDPRTAIKALLVEQNIQEQRIERLASALSFGYVRGRICVTRERPIPTPGGRLLRLTQLSPDRSNEESLNLEDLMVKDGSIGKE